MKLIPLSITISLAAIIYFPMRCPAPVNVTPGFNLIPNPHVGPSDINSVLPVGAGENDSDVIYIWNTTTSTYDLAQYFAGFGWFDQNLDPSTLTWPFGTSSFYQYTGVGTGTLLFGGVDPAQPVPVVHVGYNALGNVTGGPLGFDDIALGQLDKAVCPAYLWNKTTSSFDAYFSGVGPPLSVGPFEGVFFLKPPTMTITNSTSNSAEVIIRWEGAGELQTTTSLNGGPWLTVSNATNPYVVNRFQTNSLFFRIKLPPPPVP
jgi:hypothetical protein